MKSRWPNLPVSAFCVALAAFLMLTPLLGIAASRPSCTGQSCRAMTSTAMADAPAVSNAAANAISTPVGIDAGCCCPGLQATCHFNDTTGSKAVPGLFAPGCWHGFSTFRMPQAVLDSGSQNATLNGFFRQSAQKPFFFHSVPIYLHTLTLLI